MCGVVVVCGVGIRFGPGCACVPSQEPEESKRHHHHTTHHPAQNTERTEPGLGNGRELKHERTPAYEPTLTATHRLGGFQERTHEYQTAAEPEGIDCEAGSDLRGSDWTESLGRERLLF